MRAPLRQVLFAEAGFTPRQLFAALQGAWLEPTPGYIWQENTGITPTTTGGQTIGLLLDQSQGAVLGAQLGTGSFTNSGTFPYTTFTASGATGFVGTTSGSGSARGYVGDVSAYVNRYVEVSGTIASSGISACSLNFSSLASPSSGLTSGYALPTVNGNFLFRLPVPASALYILVASGATGASSTTLSNFSVREILGNHAAQSTAANRPTYQLDSNNLPLARHDATDSLVVSLPSINVRRNLLTYSEQFDNSAWVKTATVTGGFAPPPNTTLAQSYKITGAQSSSQYVRQTVAVTANTIYTYSVYIKNIDVPTDGLRGTYFSVFMPVTSRLALFAIRWNADGSISNASLAFNCTATIAASGSGFYRISIAFTTTATEVGNASCYIQPQNQAADATQYSILANGAQLELGSVATDYQKITDWTSEAYSSNGSVYFATPQGMSALHNQSMGLTYTLPALSTDIYSWIVVPQRLNTAQENRLARYMERRAGIAGPDTFEQEDYGPELVVNGDGSSLTGWTTNIGSGSSITPVAGEFYFVSTGGLSQIIQSILTNGKYYSVSFSYRIISGTAKYSLGGTTEYTLSGSGTVSEIRLASGANFYINRNIPGQAAEFYIDNISVRELKDGMTGQLFADDGDLLLRA